MSLSGKKILLGISGGIAAYKACELCRMLVKEGAAVRIIATQAALEFVTELSLQTLSGNKVHTKLFDLNAESEISHIELADWPDLFLVAPATANLLGKYRHGLADDLLSTCLLASQAPLIFAPAMNVNMWENPNTQNNITALREEKRVTIIEPESGDLACGWQGKGRLAPLEEIINTIYQTIAHFQPLKDKKILINAGPTREYIDPVRFISNPSSGKMGFALSQVALNLGGQVVLVTGPSALPDPIGIHTERIESVQEMFDACKKHFETCDYFIASAAIGDYLPKKELEKIKKTSDEITITLKKAPDILKTLSFEKKPHQRVIGFAAETQNLEEYALKKLSDKKLDAIIANTVQGSKQGFAQDQNSAKLFFASGKSYELKLQNKDDLAQKIWEAILKEV